MGYTDLLPWLALAGIIGLPALVYALGGRKPRTVKDAEAREVAARDQSLRHLEEVETARRQELGDRHAAHVMELQTAMREQDPDKRTQMLLDLWRRRAGR